MVNIDKNIFHHKSYKLEVLIYRDYFEDKEFFNSCSFFSISAFFHEHSRFADEGDVVF